MFTIKWMRAATMIMLLVLALPCLAQGKAPGGYDRMDGEYIKPSKREQPKRNFNITHKERLNIYSVRSSANPRAGTGVTYVTTGTSVTVDGSNSLSEDEGRNPDVARQPENSDSTAPVLNESKTEAGDSSKSGEGFETIEASDVVPESGAAPAASPILTNPNQLVFCSKRLMEFHWDQECPNLKNVKPTRMTFIDAKEARYTECTSCGGKQ